MPAPDYYIKVGDTGLDLQGVVRDENGAPKDITAATVRFHMRPLAGGTVKVNAVATNSQGALGTGAVTYSWAPVDIDTAGLFLGEWQITYASGDVQTFPNDRTGFLIQIQGAVA